MIEEENINAREELKRADHLIYVSLKYTRTVDVIESVIVRLMSAQQMTIDALLEWLEKKKKLKKIDLSKPYKTKIELIREKMKKDETVIKLLDFYEYLIKIMKADHIKKEEFRKNVRLIAHDKNGNVIEEVGIEVLKETLAEFESLAGFFFERPKEYERPLKVTPLKVGIEALTESEWNHDAMEKAIRDASDKEGVQAKDVFMELRVAITGKTVGPPLLESLEILGKTETLERISNW